MPPQSSPSRLARALRQSLHAAADPSKAPGMQAYMKSSMPYLGVQTPVLRKTVRPIIRVQPLDAFDDWREAVLLLWRNARYREERYAAIELAGAPRYREFRTLEALPLYEEMITSGAWWDYVDAIATRQLGEILRSHRAPMSAILRKWAVSDDIWKRRSAILAQLNFKRETDLELLYDCIQPSLGAAEFFLRKGIGWALRQYARTDAAEVIRYVRRNEAQLSPLSKREALRHIGGYSNKAR
ncbi:MAG: DNA alkylation repair protein [Acidobacteriia bacterium]|nr:DNA alkylation repair protein [Terriglobia bacterium]